MGLIWDRKESLEPKTIFGYSLDQTRRNFAGLGQNLILTNQESPGDRDRKVKSHEPVEFFCQYNSASSRSVFCVICHQIYFAAIQTKL